MSDDDLREKIARRIAARVHIKGEEAWREYEAYAGAVLPIVREAQAEAWAEGYGQGVDDARTADAARVDVGLGPDLYAQPARQNPYEESTDDES